MNFFTQGFSRRKAWRYVFAFSLVFACMSFIKASAYDLVVAQDGSGNYTTIQAAINAAPNNSAVPFTIFIKNGKYREKITVPSTKTFIQLTGESVANVFVYYDDPATVLGTQNSASFSVNANDFTAINITFANTYGDGSQAVAVLVNADRAAFKNCRFLGNQDTLYLKGSGTPRAYFKNCYIDGNIDFIFGSSVALFDSCVVYAKTRTSAGASYITAPNTPTGQAYGFIFKDARLPNNVGGTSYYLSRPWPSPSEAGTRQKTVFLASRLSSHIQAAGWSTWDANTVTANLYYGEYKSRYFNDLLVDVSQRVPWSYQLTQGDSSTYTLANIFSGWDPCGVVAGFCNTTNGGDIAVSNFRGVKGSTTSSFNWNISWPISGIQYDLYRSNAYSSGYAIINTQTSVNDTAVNFSYSENIPPPGQTYYYYVSASKAGYASHITDTISISSTPTITVTGTLGSFLQGVGIPSNPQAYTVSGASLTNDIIITAPPGYEISSNGGTTWNNSSNPITLTQTGGNVATTTITVRLNASSAGTYSGNITHTSTGAVSVNQPVTGTVQSTPLTVSTLLEQWPFTVSNADSAAVRAPGIVGTTPTFSKLYLSNGTTVPAVPAYSALHGQAYGASSNGDGTWTTAVGGPGGNLNRTIYEQFTITAAAGYSVRVDSLILSSSFYNTSSNTKLAVVYSKTGFSTADSTDVTGTGGLGSFANPILLTNETFGTNATYRIAFNGAAGVNLAAGETLTFRIYNSCSSSSPGRYGKIKNLYVMGLSTLNPVAGDYQTHQSGDWTDLNTWERYDGTNWVTPAPAYPVYNNSGTTSILAGHAVTISSTLANGSGYIHLTKVKQGGSLILASGATLNLANDGTPSTATTDLQIDGSFTANGVLGTNGNVSIVINGIFVNSTTSMNLSNAGDSVFINNGGTYQHNTNSNNTPANLKGLAGSNFNVTGITSNQTGIFKSSVTYGNITWNCPSQGGYYAFRSTLSNNVLGSFTLVSSGSTYVSFANANAKVTFPGGFYQTGGIVNFRESGTVNDTLSLGGDFSVTGGTFNSNTGGANTFVVELNGTNKTINYTQSGATNTNWNVNGIYTLASNLALPSSGFGVVVNGTLNAGANTMSGSGNFTMSTSSTFISSSANGLDGNITVSGTKSFGTTGNFIFNGASAQSTGTLLPANITSLTINNNANVSLGAGTALSGALNLTSGKLKLGANNISTASVVGSSSTNYVVTDGVGALKINNIGAGNTVFPVGPTTTNYNPVTLNNAGTADNFSVSVKNTFDNAVPDPNKVVNDQWTITEETPGGTNATVSLSWIVADQASGFNPAASNVIRFNGSAWISTGATVTGAGTIASPYTATASGFTAFSPFGVNNSGTLPLNLLSFNASFDGTKAKATWTTVNERNVRRFTLQRSNDANNFVDVVNVDAKNNIQQTDYYAYDLNPLTGISYYRLKSEDVDGAIKYSNIASINNTKLAVLRVYPNPVQNNFVLSHQKAVVGATLEIYASDGKLVTKINAVQNAMQTDVNTSLLANGSYHLVFRNGNDVQQTNFIKK